MVASSPGIDKVRERAQLVLISVGRLGLRRWLGCQKYLLNMLGDLVWLPLREQDCPDEPGPVPLVIVLVKLGQVEDILGLVEDILGMSLVCAGLVG